MFCGPTAVAAASKGQRGSRSTEVAAEVGRSSDVGTWSPHAALRLSSGKAAQESVRVHAIGGENARRANSGKVKQECANLEVVLFHGAAREALVILSELAAVLIRPLPTLLGWSKLGRWSNLRQTS